MYIIKKNVYQKWFIIEKMKTITLLHGSKKFTGKVEIRESKKGHYESGVGFYMTTSYNTARKYANSSHNVMTVTLEELTFLSAQHKLSVDDFLDFIDSQYRMKGKNKVMREFYNYVESDNTMKVQHFINLLVMNESLAGKTGVNLAKWLVEKGIDAVIENHVNQDWVILFNAAKVIDIKNNAHNFEDVKTIKEQVNENHIKYEKEILSENVGVKKNKCNLKK